MDTILKESSITKKVKSIILCTAIVSAILGLIFLLVNISLYNAHDYKVTYISYFFEYPYVYFSLVATSIAIFFCIVYLMTRPMQITITDKRVYGKTYFGRSVDLPMDSISAVGSSWFKGIAVATSSGKISFLFIENSKEIHELLRKLLIDRQEKAKHEESKGIVLATSNADELKKYKELFDCGIISQEEFDIKKKQLLGL